MTPDGDAPAEAALGAAAAGDGPAGDGPAAPLGARLLELVAVMSRLRAECPWDARQTHASLAPYLLEESYEALDALESGDLAALREELGDVLLQVAFHGAVASERTDGTGFTIDDIADGIVAKLRRRHPHVFGDVTVTGADEVTLNWDAIKAAERAGADGSPASAFAGVPFGQPALSLAAQLQRRAERAGAPAELAPQASQPDQDGLDAAAGQDDKAASGPVSEIGAGLFALVLRARQAGLDPEFELRAAARAYRDQVLAWERGQPG
ncbi:MAG: MazG family protein [Actinomycetota bacterium]